MKKYGFSILVFCLIVLSVISGCKGSPTTPTEKTPTAQATATPTFTPAVTHTFTPTYTQSTGIVTPTFTPTFTPSITVSITISVTGTFTPSMTPTISPTMVCFNPHISAGEFKFNQQTLPNTTLYFTGACRNQSGIAYKAAVYDASNNLVAAATAVQTACGELRYTFSAPIYTPTSMALWHVAIMEPTQTPPAVYNASAPEFYDTDNFYVMEFPPVPTPTAPCTDMAATYAGFCDSGTISGLIKEYTFRLSQCERVNFVNKFCERAYKVAFYDAAGQLKKIENCSCPSVGVSTQTAHYVFDGTETAGLWHVDLFGEFETPPHTRGSGGTYQPCPPNITFQVQ